MTNPNEVTASNSHAVMATEIAELRKHLRLLIAKGKQFAHWIPNQYRPEFLQVQMDAEKQLTK